MKRQTVSGFTLIEIIVVLAILGILAGILVPSLIGYVQKAKRRADMASAKVIHEDILMVLLSDATYVCSSRTPQGDIPFDATPMQSFYRYNTTVINAPIDGADKSGGTYPFVVVAKMDGARAKDFGGGGALSYWTAGNQEAQGFAAALNQYQGIQTSVRNDRTFGIKLHSVSYEGNETTRWLIGYQKNNPDCIEVWVCQSKSGWGCGGSAFDVIYRLYPDPATPYK